MMMSHCWPCQCESPGVRRAGCQRPQPGLRANFGAGYYARHVLLQHHLGRSVALKCAHALLVPGSPKLTATTAPAQPAEGQRRSSDKTSTTLDCREVVRVSALAVPHPTGFPPPRQQMQVCKQKQSGTA
eukprot:1087192-Rhodomonas_salina.2